MPILRKSCTRRLPPKSNKGRAGVLAVLGLVMLFAAVLGLRMGSQDISFKEILSALAQGNTKDTVWRIIVHARVPRVLAGMCAGAALAAAGVLMQGVLSNPMASPNVIGVNSGAGFAVMLCAALFPRSAAMMPAAAFLGAFVTAMFIYALAARAGLAKTTIILAGVAVSSILTAGVNAITLLFPEVTVGASGFMMGGFSGVTLNKVKWALPYLLVGGAAAQALAMDLNLLPLGEESASALGLNVRRTRFAAIAAAALLAGGAVSFSGLLGFVGLLVPHMGRRFIGNDCRWLIPASAMLGAAFVLLCDVLARVVFAPFEVPVGIVMSLLGGPFFLSLLLRGRKEEFDG